MKRLRNNLIGIAQGSEVMFEDFDVGGEMWTGTGPREAWHQVRFADKYRTPPVVHVSLSMWDMDISTNHRVDLAARNVRRDGFELVFTTWEDSKIARVRADWMAIGELLHEDDWDLY